MESPIQILKQIIKNKKKIYILVNKEGITGGIIPLKGYASKTGRLDEIARSFLSIKNKESVGIAVLEGPPNPPLSILYDPAKCYDKANERSIIMSIKKAYEGGPSCLLLLRLELLDIIRLLKHYNYNIILLKENAIDISKIRKIKKGVYILGTHEDIPEEDLMKIKSYIDLKTSIGPISYHASQVITYLEYIGEVC